MNAPEKTNTPPSGKEAYQLLRKRGLKTTREMGRSRPFPEQPSDGLLAEMRQKDLVIVSSASFPLTDARARAVVRQLPGKRTVPRTLLQ